ncbi:ATP-binding protein [Thioalkalivibrio sp. ALJ1]|uniref:ATP-binding protein n=1 Tax=Thioalkalivibrio sp. ALJ1 TaxID=1158144 RepID=UPI00056E8467|nr:ATP-binding protein [Thioalkalivibrio sp. ALJ1]
MRCSLDIGNELTEIPRLAGEVEAFCERAGMEANTVNLALDEWITNLVSYAFDDGGEHRIGVELEADTEGLTVVVTDDGHSFHPLEDAPEVSLEGGVEDRAIGGLGLYFIRTLMDDIQYDSADGVNRLRLRRLKRK